MKKIRQRILASVLTGAMLLSMCGSAFAVEPGGGDPDGHPNSPDQLTVDDIQSIQAYTDETMYGTGVVEVEITYADNVTLPDALSAEDYILEDRGSLSPDFAPIEVDAVETDGQCVTLTIGNHTAATDKNALIYTGTSSDKGIRERNALGIYCTGAWYRDAQGTIHYGKEGNEEAGYAANTTGMGYQARACLELKLRHAGEAEDKALCLADETGQYTNENKWLPTIDRQFGEGKFQSFAELGIQVDSTANNSAITDGTDDAYVRGYAYIPENYDPANGIVFTLQGQGISYWKLGDGTDDDGTGIKYDSATTSWANKGAIVVNIHDRSSTSKGEYWDYYDFVKDDVSVMKYFIEEYDITGNIVLQGNSRGTMASAMVIKALAGQSYNPKNQEMNGSAAETYSLDTDEFNFTVDAYICQNGTFGYQYDDDDWSAVAATGLKVWAFDGEQDSNNIESIAKYTAMMAKRKGGAWAAENVRLTGYPSELYCYWGESDHSTTRINGWYFDDAAYYGPDFDLDENGEIVYNTKLSAGDTYTLTGRGTAATNGKQEYAYTVYDELYQEWALQAEKADASMKDIDQVTKADIDYTQSAQIPLEGWYQKTLTDGRTVKLYFPEYAACRAYFTVVAVDDDVTDVQAWADQQGYTDLMDQRGEVLVILEPGPSGWGTLENELAYVTEAMAFVNAGQNANKITLFTNYSTFYLVGYGQGAAGLEAWAAENPILVGSQAYINGTGAGSSYLAQAGAKTYDGTNTGGYDPGIADEEQFKQVLKDHGYEARLISRSEVPVPTWFVGTADESSVSYWKSANDCVDTAAADGIYWQSKDSNAFQTEYANSCTTEDHGISQVKVSSDEVVTASELADFLYAYSRYNVPFAYSNHLSERQDYATIRAAAQKTAQSSAYLSDAQKVEYSQPITADSGTVYDSYYVLAREQGQVGQGTMESGIVAFSDDNGDGTLDAREYLMYIPDSAKDTDAPIVFQFPGMTQSVAVGFDSTQWWRVANDEGVIIVILGEAYNNGVALSWKNSDMAYHAVRDILEKDSSIHIDWNRVYGSGHSLGSSQVQGFTRTHPEFFAAVASTSFASNTEGFYQPVPTMLVNGQSDLPFLMEDLWTASQMRTWFEYLAKADSLKVTQATPDNADSKVEGTARTWTYTWNNTDEIPMVVWGETFVREHNCYPAEIPMAWDFLKHYSKDESGKRTYSPSAFADSDDAQTIKSSVPDLDDVTDLQKDFSQAAQLPLTGYFTKTVSNDRTVKVYIAPEASIRSYFTVVAVPDGVDTYQFLQKNGWFDLADEKGEGLFILEPGAAGWGSAQAEAAYLEDAFSFLKSGNNVHKQNVFSTFGEFYLVGYGNGAAALELWAAANPILVISQTYVNGQSAGVDALTAVASTPYDGKSSNGDITDVLSDTLSKVGTDGQIAPKDVPVPTYFIDYTGSESYWKAANDCVDRDVDGVYYQDINSKAYQTEYANSKLIEAGAQYGIAQVKISDQSASPAQIYSWMSQYTRYDTTFAYSNAIAYRLDYTSARVAAQQDAKDGKVNETLSDGTQIWAQEDVVIDGHGTVQVGVVAFSDNSGDGQWDPREYMLYIPQGFQGEKLPVMIIFPGNTQTDSIFMDSTLWWQIAEEEGIALAFVCETYNASPSSVSHADTDKFYYSLMTLLKEKIDGTYADLDFTRVYGSGQSAGSNASQGFAITNPEFFAAVASTSAGPTPGDNAAYRLIPSMMVTGQMDAGDMAKGFDAAELQRWANYMLKANGFNSTFAAETATSVTAVDSRHPELYTWSKTIRGVEVPLVQWSQCLLRPHNCYPSDMLMLWDFLEHFSFVKGSDGSLTRYYSASAFADNDAVVIDYIAGSSSVDDSDNSSSSGSSSTVSNSITVETSKNGSVSVRPTKASQGTTVMITVDAADGYELDSLTVTDKNGKNVMFKAQGSGKYTFTMPATAVTVDASFKAIQVTKPGLPFTDVSEKNWFYDAVVYAYESGLMSGTSTSTFAPNQSLTRAMVAQVIYNLEGTPTVSGTLFSDVSAGQWYTNAITWAAQNDLVSGYGNGKFGPNDLVTREQLAVILHHYAQFKKYSTASSGTLASFSDQASASDWAVDSLIWAVGNGVISGKGGSTLDPKGAATRAEVAQMFMNFLEN